MSTLIVAFPKLEEAKAVRNLLIHRGFDVAVPCTSGAQAINQADTLSDGIIDRPTGCTFFRIARPWPPASGSAS